MDGTVILVLKFIIVLVFISFLVNYFNFYIIFHEQSFLFYAAWTTLLICVDSLYPRITTVTSVQESEHKSSFFQCV